MSGKPKARPKASRPSRKGSKSKHDRRAGSEHETSDRHGEICILDQAGESAYARLEDAANRIGSHLKHLAAATVSCHRAIGDIVADVRRDDVAVEGAVRWLAHRLDLSIHDLLGMYLFAQAQRAMENEQLLSDAANLGFDLTPRMFKIGELDRALLTYTECVDVDHAG